MLQDHQGSPQVSLTLLMCPPSWLTVKSRHMESRKPGGHYGPEGLYGFTSDRMKRSSKKEPCSAPYGPMFMRAPRSRNAQDWKQGLNHSQHKAQKSSTANLLGRVQAGTRRLHTGSECEFLVLSLRSKGIYHPAFEKSSASWNIFVQKYHTCTSCVEVPVSPGISLSIVALLGSKLLLSMASNGRVLLFFIKQIERMFSEVICQTTSHFRTRVGPFHFHCWEARQRATGVLNAKSMVLAKVNQTNSFNTSSPRRMAKDKPFQSLQ